MAERKVKLWYDPEGDFLEVIFDQKPRYFRETSSEQVMEKVDEEGEYPWVLCAEGQFPEAGTTGGCALGHYRLTADGVGPNAESRALCRGRELGVLQGEFP